jgi:hypothetical protein
MIRRARWWIVFAMTSGYVSPTFAVAQARTTVSASSADAPAVLRAVADTIRRELLDSIDLVVLSQSIDPVPTRLRGTAVVLTDMRRGAPHSAEIVRALENPGRWRIASGEFVARCLVGVMPDGCSPAALLASLSMSVPDQRGDTAIVHMSFGYSYAAAPRGPGGGYTAKLTLVRQPQGRWMLIRRDMILQS